MNDGDGAVSFASIDPDNFDADATRQNITKMLRRRMVNIATIQTTHIPRNINYRSDGYRIKTSASAKDTQRQWIATGGVSVIIHTELEQPITQIMGESRAMYIALGSWKSHAPITILATYAPRSARKKEEQKEH